jgi:hypothetical protein
MDRPSIHNQITVQFLTWGSVSTLLPMRNNAGLGMVAWTRIQDCAAESAPRPVRRSTLLLLFLFAVCEVIIDEEFGAKFPKPPK